MNCSSVTTPLMATALELLCGAKTIVSAANQPASVRLSVRPVELQICNCVIVTNSQVTLEADVSDADGQVTWVVFYREYTRIGEATTAPYALAGQELASGQNFFRAAATDVQGTVTFSPWLRLAWRPALILPCSGRSKSNASRHSSPMRTYLRGPVGVLPSA